MIILLGGGGYVGQAYQRLFTRGGLPFRNVARRELDYGDTTALTALLRDTGATFLLNAAGYTGKPNVDACEAHKAACLDGNAVLPGRILAACEAAGVPWGHVSSGCIYAGERPGRRRLAGGRRAQFLLPHEPLLLLQRHQGAGRGGARRSGQPLRLAVAHPLLRGGQPAQLPFQDDALRPFARRLQLPEPVGRVLRGHLRVLAKTRALRHLQRHQPWSGDHPRGSSISSSRAAWRARARSSPSSTTRASSWPKPPRPRAATACSTPPSSKRRASG